jgi:hypothetical protein
METITNPYDSSDALSQKAKEAGRKRRDADNQKYYPNDPNPPHSSYYPFAFGYLVGEVSRLYSEIRRLQEKLAEKS